MARPLLALLIALAAVPAVAAGASPAAAPASTARKGAPKIAAASKPATSAAPAAEAPAAAPQPVETFAFLRLPLLSDRFAAVPIGMVDGEAITLAQLNEALAVTHGAHTEETHAGGRDVAPILERLVTLRLFVAEAREMGLDEQPGFRKTVAEFKEQQLRQLSEYRATRDVRPDALEVEKLYKSASREWKVRSLLFEKKEDADAFRAEVAAGKAFADLAKEALASGRATGNEGADWVARSAMLPQVADAVSRIETAPACTDPVAVKGGHAVAAVEEVRYPDDPKARAVAEASSVERQRSAKLARYRADLEKKYVHTEKLWKALDFEAPKPGFAALAKDRRAVATLKGGKPVTIADVAAEMQHWFFHGVDEPIKEKKLNAAKDEILHKILTRRLFLHAGAQGGIPASPEYRKAVSEYEDSFLFGAYVQAVVMPEVKVSEEAGKAYYEQHRSEFTYPAFYKLEALGFAKPQAADAAMKKLTAGTDFGFLRANAEGQLKPDERAVALDGQTISANTLPPELVQALAGAKRDEVRAVATGGQSFLVRVIEVTPAKEQPYLEARAAIGKKLAAEDLNRAVKDVAAKLRTSHQVSVFLERIGN